MRLPAVLMLFRNVGTCLALQMLLPLLTLCRFVIAVQCSDFGPHRLFARISLYTECSSHVACTTALNIGMDAFNDSVGCVSLFFFASCIDGSLFGRWRIGLTTFSCISLCDS